MKMKAFQFWKLLVFQNLLPPAFPLFSIPRTHPPLWRSAAHKTKWGGCNLVRRLPADLCSSILATAGGTGAGGEQKRRLTLGSLHHHPAPTYHCISHPYCLHTAINVSAAPFKVHPHLQPNPFDLMHVSTIVIPQGPLGAIIWFIMVITQGDFSNWHKS